MTTITEDYDRVSISGVREELLDRQASALQLPFIKVRIPTACTTEEYEERLATALAGEELNGVERDTNALARDMMANGFRAFVVCVDPEALDASIAGRPFDGTFLRDLPKGRPLRRERRVSHLRMGGADVSEPDSVPYR